MSYCRITPKKCDVYVYCGAPGWVTDVASRVGLALDGQRFIDPSPAACHERLVGLAKQGYKVPGRTLSKLLAEAKAPRQIADRYTEAFGIQAVYIGGGWIRVCNPLGASSTIRTTDALRRVKRRLALNKTKKEAAS